MTGGVVPMPDKFVAGRSGDVDRYTAHGPES
jgi:hypothetical protein